jgi:hypothetical protein
MLSFQFEYRVVPALRRAPKVKTVASADARFALALAQKMNEMGREGWEYVRTDTLPMDERVGLTGTKTSYVNMLVFRRAVLHSSRTVDPANEDFDISAAVFDAPKTIAQFPEPHVQDAVAAKLAAQ